jgi:hypothetical protein
MKVARGSRLVISNSCIISGTERIDVALQFDRQAGPGAHEVEEGFVRRALVETLYDGNIHAFFENRAALGAHAEAADVDNVGGVGEQADDGAVVEGGGDDSQVVQMAGTEPGVVGDVVVARAHGGGGEFLQEVADGFGHGVDVAGGAGDGLCHHAPVQVEDAGGQVSGFAHRGGEGGADHDLSLFLDHRDQAVPHDLAMDLGECVGLM